MEKLLSLKKYPDFVTFQLPAIIWMVLIFTLSSIPGSSLEKFEFPFAHLIAHIVLYGTLYYLCYRALTHQRIGRFRSGTSMLFAYVVVGLYGMSDEFHQSFVPGRSEEIKVSID